MVIVYYKITLKQIKSVISKTFFLTLFNKKKDIYKKNKQTKKKNGVKKQNE